MNKVLTGKVVSVRDSRTLVINKGYVDGVTMNNRFLVYFLGEQIIDPDTNEDLGQLEIVCGEGKTEHIQERITTIVTDMQIEKRPKTIKRQVGLFGGTTEETYAPDLETRPFQNVKVGCLFKQIS